MASLSTNWQQTSVASASGSKSAKVDQSIDAGTSVELYSPAYNFAAMPGVALNFKWAGAERDITTTASFDILSVQFSTDCGTTWTPRLTRNIKAGSVGVSATQSGNFVPNSSQFYQDNVPLANLTTATNVMFKFKFTAETGSSNNFYIDDINLSSATGIAEIPLVSNILIFPNPASDLVTVDFDLADNKNVSVEMKDVLGRVVKTGDAKPLQAGHHQISIPLSDIAKGIYFISVRSNAQVLTQKLVIE
jgi:hypothetical protein